MTVLEGVPLPMYLKYLQGTTYLHSDKHVIIKKAQMALSMAYIR